MSEKPIGDLRRRMLEDMAVRKSLGVRTAVLTDAPIPIPTIPTHVNTAPLKVFKEASCKGSVVQQLQKFTPLAVIESKRGCAQIATEGNVIGYVSEVGLQKLAGPAAPSTAPSVAKAKKNP